MNSLIGHSLGRYHLLEKLGEGGMAVVYKAYDTHLEHEVAVKVIRIDNLPRNAEERALKRFEREAKAVARLDHPNIVKVTDYGEYQGSPYLVMPYLPGGTLKQYLKEHGRVRWQTAARMLVPIAGALAYAHEQGLIHRDVKPSNILLTTSGEPLLTDFGVAKVVDEEVTQDLTGTSATVGTPEYMAPEQVVSKTVDHRADIYALGVVFFEMVTGKRPFEADTPMAVLFKHASAPLPRPQDLEPDLPDEVERVLLKALAKRPEDRYPDMVAFFTTLEKLEWWESGKSTEAAVVQLSPSPVALDQYKTVDQFTNFVEQEKQHAIQENPIISGTQESQTATVQPAGVGILPFIVAGAAVAVLLVIGILSSWFRSKPTNLTFATPVHTISPIEISSSSQNNPPETLLADTKVPEENQNTELTTTIINNLSIPLSLLGIWINEDSNTGSITQVVITSNKYPNAVEIWGSCSPNDCYWNSDPYIKYEITQVMENSMQIVWTFDFIERVMDFILLSDGRIQINTQNHFTDDSNREDFISTDYFFPSENLLNYEGLWIGTSDEVTGDKRAFDMNINFSEVSSVNVIGTRYIFLDSYLFEENNIQNGSLDGTNIRFMDDDGRYFWGKISQNKINGYISWDCYECGYWGIFAVNKSISD